jgi:hypothetical protein
VHVRAEVQLEQLKMFCCQTTHHCDKAKIVMFITQLKSPQVFIIDHIQDGRLADNYSAKIDEMTAF